MAPLGFPSRPFRPLRLPAPLSGRGVTFTSSPALDRPQCLSVLCCYVLPCLAPYYCSRALSSSSYFHAVERRQSSLLSLFLLPGNLSKRHRISFFRGPSNSALRPRPYLFFFPFSAKKHSEQTDSSSLTAQQSYASDRLAQPRDFPCSTFT